MVPRKAQRFDALPDTIADVSLLPYIPSPLAEASAVALEWPRLRELIAGRASSPLGRAWVLALEPSANRVWIEAQQQRTGEIRDLLTGGGSFEFHGMIDPTERLEQARIEGAALEALEINALLTVVERIAAWRALLISPAGRARVWPGIAGLSAALVEHDFAPLLQTGFPVDLGSADQPRELFVPTAAILIAPLALRFGLPLILKAALLLPFAATALAHQARRRATFDPARGLPSDSFTPGYSVV